MGDRSKSFNYTTRKTCWINEKVEDTHRVLEKYNCSVTGIIELCGGIPRPDIVKIDLQIRSVSAGAVDVAVKCDLYVLQRTIDFSLEMIANTVMYINERGSHIGLTLFLNQVSAARMMGFKELTVFATGSPGQDEWDGYYFWARVGYSMIDAKDIEDAIDIINFFEPGRSLSELILTNEGYRFWQQNGFPWNGRFLLHDESDNLKHLRKYLKMKEINYIL